MDLEKLLRGARDREPDAWIRLAPALGRALRRFFIERGFNEADARDLGQRTVTIVYARIPGFVPRRNLTSWVFGVARNLGRKELQKRARQREIEEMFGAVPPTPNTGPSSRLRWLERRRLFLRCVERLPPHYRRALLHEFAGRTIESAARLDDIALATARSRRYRAHERLREQIAALTDPSSTGSSQ